MANFNPTAAEKAEAISYDQAARSLEAAHAADSRVVFGSYTVLSEEEEEPAFVYLLELQIKPMRFGSPMARPAWECE